MKRILLPVALLCSTLISAGCTESHDGNVNDPYNTQYQQQEKQVRPMQTSASINSATVAASNQGTGAGLGSIAVAQGASAAIN